MVDGATPSVERLLTESVWLTALARALLREDEHAAEDVAQEARLAALRDAPEDPDHARAWLVRVARNFALRTHLRRTRRERRERAAAVPEALPSTLDLVARVNAQKRVADAVVKLDEPYRSVVLLRYFDALTARDIAERQRVPIETVRTRLKRALAQLRERLDKDFGKRDAWAGLLLPWALPVEGAVTSVAAGAKAAGVHAAGGAAVVGTGVLAMSTLAKSVVAVACVVAAAVTWRAVRDRGPVHADAPARTTAESGALQRDRSNVGREAAVNPDASAGATREAESVAKTDPTVDASSQKSSFHITATVVAAADERPVAGATLRITYLKPVNGVASGPELAADARSDASGRADVVLSTDDPQGSQWEVHADGFVMGGGWRFDVPPTAHGRHDLGTIRLERGAAIRGRVVHATTRAPVAGAELRFDRWTSGSLSMLDFAHPSGTSAEDGSFTLLDRLSAPPEKRLALYALSADLLAIGSYRIPAAATEVNDVEVVLREPATLQVTIRDDAGSTIEGATVVCLPRFLPFTRPRMFDALTEFTHLKDPRLVAIFAAKSDANGVATLARLPPAPSDPSFESEKSLGTPYDVAVRADDHEPGMTQGVRVDPGRPARCTVVARRTRFVNVVGRVVRCDRERSPIPDASIRVHALPSDRTLQSDENGEFEIERIPTTWGSFHLAVTADGMGEWEHYYSFADLQCTPASAGGGATADACRIEIVMERSARIAGRVVNEDDAPIEGAVVFFSHYNPDRTQSASMRKVPRPTDADGRFEFMATEADWQVESSAPRSDGSSAPLTQVFAKGGTTDLEIRVVTRAARAAKVTCEVVDAGSGAALPLASAWIEPAAGFRGNWNLTQEKSLGSVVVSGLFEGRWRIDVETTDHRRASREFDVASDHDDVRLRFEIGALARVRGRVEPDAARAAATSRPVRVYWHPADARLVDESGRILSEKEPAESPVPADGRFFLDGFVPGKVARIFLTDFDTVFDEVVFTASRDEFRDVVLHWTPAAHVALRSRADTSKGALTVDLARDDEPWHREFWRIRTQIDDARDPPHTLRPGHYRWRAFLDVESDADEPPLVTSASGEFDVSAGETHVLRIDELR